MSEEKKDCAFQFAVGGDVIIDTGLITRSRANELWREHKRRFVRAVECGETAEVALWINMSSPTNYSKSAFHLRSGDWVMVNGRCYMLQPLP